MRRTLFPKAVSALLSFITKIQVGYEFSKGRFSHYMTCKKHFIEVLFLGLFVVAEAKYTTKGVSHVKFSFAFSDVPAMSK